MTVGRSRTVAKGFPPARYGAGAGLEVPFDWTDVFGSDEEDEAAEGVGEGRWWLFVAEMLLLTGF